MPEGSGLFGLGILRHPAPRFEFAGGRRMLPVPTSVQRSLERVDTIDDAIRVLQAHEPVIAAACGRHDFIDCDQMATLLSQWLEWQDIPHQVVIGESDIGDTHAWVRVDGENIDPTEQGFGDGDFKVVRAYP